MKKIIITFSIFIFGFNIYGQKYSDEQYMNAYIIVSDTSQNYFELRKKMFILSEKLKKKIDTMERGFNKTKNLICLPENNKDEIYARYYLPRRFPSKTISLEYIKYYQWGKKTSESTIALVTAITNNKEIAKNELVELKKYSNNAFIINTKIYMGCMH